LRGSSVRHARSQVAQPAEIGHGHAPFAVAEMPTRTQLIFILGALTAFGPFSTDMYLPSFTVMARDMNASQAAVQATLSAFLIGLAAGQLVLGPLSDRYGRRLPLIAGIVLYIAAALACALAPNIETLWVARFFQSLGVCAMIVVSRATVRDFYSGAEGAHFLSMLMLVLGFAPMIGPPIGAFILEEYGWRGIFYLHAVLGALVLTMVLLVFPESLPKSRRARGGILGVLKGYVTLLQDRHYIVPTIAGDLVFAGLFAFLAGGPFVLASVYGLEPQHFAFVFSFNAFGFLLGTQINARLVRRYGPAKMLTVGLLLYGLAAIALLFNTLTGFGGLAGVVVPLFLLFLSVGAAPANALALAQEHYPHMAGSAAALFGSIQFGIGAISGILVGLLHDGTAVPMAGIIVAAAAIALTVNLLLTPKEARRC
jgi:DHA1 family bicyclomycin/chloramphenicol resistance-like MFS transporter